MLLSTIALLALVWWATLPRNDERQLEDVDAREADLRQTGTVLTEPAERQVRLMALQQGPDGWESREAALSDTCLAARKRLARELQ